MDKICAKCGKEFPATPEYFYRNKRGRQGLRPNCKTCDKKWGQKWRQSSKGKVTERKCKLKYLYGITLDEYDEMFDRQNGCCAICGEPEIGRRLSVDHNHKTGQVRALLCQGCNASLGKIEQVGIGKFVKYLEDFYEV